MEYQASTGREMEKVIPSMKKREYMNTRKHRKAHKKDTLIKLNGRKLKKFHSWKRRKSLKASFFSVREYIIFVDNTCRDRNVDKSTQKQH